MVNNLRPRIGMLWGDFPWTSEPKKLGKLWSMGRVARDVTYALREKVEVIPYNPPENKIDEREVLISFLKSIDILWADIYPSSATALTLRNEMDLHLPAILFAGGAIPKGAEAMLFPWQNIIQSNDGIIFSCRADQEIWKRLVEWSDLKEWVIPLSVDETVFYPRTLREREEIRRKHNIPIDSPFILYVGRLNLQKNVHTLLHMFAAVQEQVEDVHLCIVGEEDDISFGEFRVRNTGYLDWLRRMSNNLRIAEKVKFVGPLFGEELARMYSAADVVVNIGFYHRENFGLSQAEAASCGIPVVCTFWGGFKDVVQNGRTGYFIDAVLTKNGIRVDWAYGANLVIKILQQPNLGKELGIKAAAYAKQHFSIDALKRSLGRVMEEVLEKVNKDVIKGIAYKPSEFAERYETNKRASGWYGATGKGIDWYQPMFQGKDYELYETLMQPYSTRLAEDWGIESVKSKHIPCFASFILLDSTRFLISNDDPIWPHRRFLSQNEWEVIQLVDGIRTLDQIVTLSGKDISTCIKIIWAMYLDGFILFKSTINDKLLSKGTQ